MLSQYCQNCQILIKVLKYKFLWGGAELTPTIAIMNLIDRHSEMPDIFLASLCEAVLATNI